MRTSRERERIPVREQARMAFGSRTQPLWGFPEVSMQYATDRELAEGSSDDRGIDRVTVEVPALFATQRLLIVRLDTRRIVRLQ